MSLKHFAETQYNIFLKLIERAIGRQVTYASTLEELGNYLFGEKFLGTYAYDEIPRAMRGYAIVNLDKHDMPGSHWVAMADSMVYDSFGRDVGLGTTTERDIEQEKIEDDCGQRCIAFLCVYHAYGPEIAYFI